MGFVNTTKRKLRDLLLFKLRWPGVYEALLKVEHRLFGRRIGLETCSRCQLKCPLCSTAHPKDDWRRDHQDVIGQGSLKLEDFRRFLDAHPRLRKIEISNWGEVFLNKELPAILKLAHERGVGIEASNGVNLNAASDEALAALVDYQVRHVLVSIDGATDESYRIYRRGGNLARVLANVDRINELKRLRGSPYPRLTWRMIIFGHNEHEIAQARNMAAERGMAFATLMNLEDGFSPVKDPERVERETGLRIERDLGRALENAGKRLDFCGQMWDSPQVNWDGKVLGCCCNNMGDFGNAFEEGLEKVLAGERYVYAKRMLLGLEPARADIPCTSCPIYRGTPFAAPVPAAASKSEPAQAV